ncbi:hypothetical protein PsYK624_106340 [Phanerochaete sordida]|uniref:Uncharacterized protein n=1 Tax=Phanerochaete sordida TaxID=48140 RepID=A0A9P3LHA0_9APHY|nr:hypothetical protein PsYK624_106340 [Phanerochaete sordida]
MAAKLLIALLLALALQLVSGTDVPPANAQTLKEEFSCHEDNDACCAWHPNFDDVPEDDGLCDDDDELCEAGPALVNQAA